MRELLEGGLYFDAVVVMQLKEEAAVERLMVPATFDELEEKRLAALENPADDDEKTEEELDAEIEELREAEDNERRDNITEVNGRKTEEIERVVAVLSEKAIPMIEIDAAPRAGKVFRAAEKKLHPYIVDRSLLLYQAVECPGAAEAAEKALAAHTRQLSHFGRNCPVCTEQGAAIRASQYAPPVVYRHHLFYPRTAAEAQTFIACPRFYSLRPAQNLSTPPRCFVTGPIRSGRTSTAQKIMRDTRATHISLQQILTKILNGESALRDEIETLLRTGEVLSDELCVRALKWALRSHACVRDGWVVDAFPTNRTQAFLIEEAGVVPHSVFITAPVADVAQKQGGNPAQAPQMFQEAIQQQQEEFEAPLKAIEEFYSAMHGNSSRLIPAGSQWERGAQASATVWKAAQAQSRWLLAECEDRPVPAADLGFKPAVQQALTGKLLDLCPVTLQEKQAFAKSPPGMALAVLFRGQIYKCLNKENMQKFIDDPAAYLHGVSLLASPLGGRLPIPIPGLPECAPTVAADQALEGHCPVSLWMDPTNPNCVVPGSRVCQVQLGDLVFRISNTVALKAFLQKPWAYSDLVLPAKMPAGRAVVPLVDLPARGYCEQTLARAVTAALNELCEARPKFPGLTVQDSVLKYLALHMRCNNKNENEEQHESSQQLFDEYQRSCQLAEFLKTEPEDIGEYRDKQQLFEDRRCKPWEPFLQ